MVTTEAIVLRTYNLAEADRIAVCLTRSAGLVRAVARGARRMRSRFGAAFEPFSIINLVFYEKENRELVTVSQAEIVKSNFALASQPGTSDALAYMAELVGEFAPPHEANDKLFRMVRGCVEALALPLASPNHVLRYFEIWLLRLSGLFPALEFCADCGRRFADDERIYLDAEPKPRCHQCSGGHGAFLSAPTRRTVTATKRLPPSDFTSVGEKLAAEEQAQLAQLTQRLLTRALERRPRTVIAHAG